MKTIEFTVYTPQELPPKSGFYDGTTSSPVFAKCLTIQGKERNATAVYDYSHNKWRFFGAGIKEIIEWYETT
ncbi:hypothetical protein KDU71_07550 [Carboxylicivirga sediminis]|uniref:Uncharacterized protein n=1 Tax=Carboxylicivirga sediminis TaxID=2006564 RepID=A0A941IVX9_9BACT|nr:hypothetical protein [Carboxylicivirga sediminis]MBR8535411.1 hypothetical protein [Carboxylicivirga sediminis]